MVEVLDHYRGPDHKFRWLMAFAEDASDRTRTGFPGRRKMAWRIEKSETRVSHLAGELVADGVLQRTGGGGKHRGNAAFTLLPLAAAQGAPATHPEQSRRKPSQGAPRTHPEDRIQGAPATHPDSDSQGAPATHHRVRPGRTLTEGHTDCLKPSVPQSPTGAQDAPTAQTILKAFIDWDRGQGGQLTRSDVGQLAKRIGQLLDQGIDDVHIRRGLADWRAKGMHPSTLDSFVSAAMRGRTNGIRPSTGDTAIAQGAALKAQILAEHEQRELA